MTRCRARNWSQYNQSLVKQGSIIFWIEDSAVKGWYAKESRARGRPQVYSQQAIVALLIVRVVFGCGFRQLQGLMQDVLKLLKLGVSCPDYTTVCRRSRQVKVPVRAHRSGVLNVIFDSTGLKVYGEGEWQVRQHGPSYRRGWKKIHIGICAETQQIVAAMISDKELSDSQALPSLLGSLEGDVGEVICDGAYDCKSCYEAIYHKRARAVIPPRKSAKPSGGEDAYLKPRDMAIYRIRDQKRGRRRWKQEVNYHRRSLAETAMHRLKALTGPVLRARRLDSQLAEFSARIYILNEMTHLRA